MDFQSIVCLVLKEDGSLFSPKQLKVFSEFSKSVKDNNTQLHTKLTKKTRQIINSTQDELFKKIPILPIFNPRSIEAVFSGFSHILHGNVLLLQDILNTKRPTQLQLRIYWFLLLTGVNVVNHVGIYLQNSTMQREIERLNKDFEKTAIKVKKYWEQI